MGKFVLVSQRWVDIPEQQIIEKLHGMNFTTWGVKKINSHGSIRYFLYSGDDTRYTYSYSLPVYVVERLAHTLNNLAEDFMWHKKYNDRALKYYEKHGKPELQAMDYYDKWEVYWKSLPPNQVPPRPQLFRLVEDPNITFKPGDKYYAVIGMYHLEGSYTNNENGNNHHVYLDIIDKHGNRLNGVNFWYGYDGNPPANGVYKIGPVRIDKPGNEPGANVPVTWEMMVYGFYIPNFAVDRFSHIHTRYPDDGPFNKRGHHSTYIVIMFTTIPDLKPVDPPPKENGITPVIPPLVLDQKTVSFSEWMGEGIIKTTTTTTTTTQVYIVKDD